MVMRAQLAAPNLKLISPQIYNQMFTMHGTTMIFLVAMPVLTGFGVYLVPLMIGANETALPRLGRAQFLAATLGRCSALFQFRHRIGPECGLVQLRAAEREALLARPGRGFLGFRVADDRRRLPSDRPSTSS